LRNYQGEADPDVTLITYGGLSRLVNALLPRLAAEEIRVLACLPMSLQPLPTEALLEAVRRSRRAVIAEPGTRGFGWAAEVASLLYGELFRELQAPITMVGAYPSIIPSAFELEKEVLVSAETLEAAIVGCLS
jgi:pyruvate/2-oxoglutarate/acetoin dehydrogenase E1 component